MSARHCRLSALPSSAAALYHAYALRNVALAKRQA